MFELLVRLLLLALLMIVVMLPEFVTLLELPSRVKAPARVPKLFTLQLVALRGIPLVVRVVLLALLIESVLLPFHL